MCILVKKYSLLDTIHVTVDGSKDSFLKLLKGKCKAVLLQSWRVQEVKVPRFNDNGTG